MSVAPPHGKKDGQVILYLDKSGKKKQSNTAIHPGYKREYTKTEEKKHQTWINTGGTGEQIKKNAVLDCHQAQ